MFKILLTLSLLISFLLSSQNLAQTQVEIYPTSKTGVVRYKDPKGDSYGYSYASSFLYKIGRFNGQNGTLSSSNEDIFRSSFEFNLGDIPYGAIFSDAKLRVSVSNRYASGSNYTFNLTRLANNIALGKTSFDQAGAATAIIVDIPYTYTNNLISSKALQDAVPDAHTNGAVLYIGAISNYEGTNLSYADISLSLIVTYTLPVSNISVTVRNDFGETPYDNTKMNIDGISSSIEPTGNTYTWQSNTFPHTLGAVDQIVELPSGFYNSKIGHWSTGSQAYSISIPSSPSTYTSYYDRLCNLNFANSINGGNRGSININGTVYNAPFPQFDVWSPNAITATAIDQDYNSVHYTFSRWEDNSTSAARTVTASRHNTYTAYFAGTPLFPDETVRHLSVSQVLNQYISLRWTEHPNSDVNYYKIYRKVKDTPSWITPECIGTVPRGTLAFTDPDYVYTNNFQTILLYDVKAYCSAWGTMSQDSYQGPYYGILVKSSADSLLAKNQVFENSITNYPNPFNPATQIRYSIKEKGFVSLQVYDVLGNKVADLVNEYKPAGSYDASFDASSLPSGIYISRIKAGNYLETKKMLFVK